MPRKPPVRPTPVPASPRRRAPYLLAAALVVAAAAVGLWYSRAAARRDGPIVLISIDTLRADHLPVYGYSKVKTPAIDALAKDGVVFERAYAHSPQTLPSHASILTGRLPFETGVRDNIGFTLKPDEVTLPQRLQALGYATGGVVSAFVLRKETGIAKGFAFFDGDMPPAAPDMPMGQVQRNGTASLAVAERWMESLTSRKFFLFFHDYDPHTPYSPPERFKQFEPYDGEIAYADEVVGALIAKLKEKGWYDEATIVLLSDHGEGLGDHDELEHGLFLYDSTIHVPLVVKLPGHVRPGTRVAAPVQHIDLVPTILDLAGAPKVPSLRGRSLRPLLEGTGEVKAESASYAESLYGRYHFGWSELSSLTDARYRYIKAPRPELYDLQNDRAERRNLAAERPQAVAAARGEIDRLVAGAKADAPGQVSREDLERLQSLGYVGTQAGVAEDRPGEALPDPKDKIRTLEKFRGAIAAAASRDHAKAVDLLHEALADSPAMKDAWLQLGVELVRAGRLPEALDAFRHLVEVDPADANSLVSAGGVLQQLGRLDEARAHAEMALAKARPDDRRARTSACELLVRIALSKRDFDAARRAAGLSQQADPAFPLPAFVEGVVAREQGDFARALPSLQEAARQLQGQAFAIPELYFYMGDALANLGREDEAVAAFREELRLFPQDTRARMSLAMLFRAGGRNAEAAREIDAMMAAVPTPDGYAMAAKTWTIFGEVARASAVKAEAARRFGKH